MGAFLLGCALPPALTWLTHSSFGCRVLKNKSQAHAGFTILSMAAASRTRIFLTLIIRYLRLAATLISLPLGIVNPTAATSTFLRSPSSLTHHSLTRINLHPRLRSLLTSTSAWSIPFASETIALPRTFLPPLNPSPSTRRRHFLRSAFYCTSSEQPTSGKGRSEWFALITNASVLFNLPVIVVTPPPSKSCRRTPDRVCRKDAVVVGVDGCGHSLQGSYWDGLDCSYRTAYPLPVHQLHQNCCAAADRRVS